MNPDVVQILPCKGRQIPDAGLVRAWVASEARRLLTARGFKAGDERLVLVKPNWLQEGREDAPEVWMPVISDPDLILRVSELVSRDLRRGDTLALGDAPHTYADLGRTLKRGALDVRLPELETRAAGPTVQVLDLRRETWVRKDGVVTARIPNDPDPRGYVRIDLGAGSMLYRHHGEGWHYGADYDSSVVHDHHAGERQEYLLSGTAMQSDVFVNLPKMKTHAKTGVTCALKNLVGINGDKNWLPHFTLGNCPLGGDEFPAGRRLGRLESTMRRIGRRVALRLPLVGTWLYRKARQRGLRVFGDSGTTIRNGNWSGNDTCWRMVLDLNRAVLYGRPDGTMGSERRPYFCVVDGIVAGEGDGPLRPDPVESGVVVAGGNPAEIDAVCCRLMGFDPRRIPLVRGAFEPHIWPIARCPMDAVRAWDGRVGREIGLGEILPAAGRAFRPHFGWQNLL